MRERASPSGAPVSSSRRNRVTAAASAKASSCAGLPPAAWTARASATRNGPGKPLLRNVERGLDTAPRLSAPVGWKRSARRGRERVEPERDCAVLRLRAGAFDQSAKTKRPIGAVGPKIKFEICPCIETHAIEGLVECGGVELPKTKTVGAERAGGHDLQAVRSIGEVVERLRVGLVGMGMIESRDDPPRTAGSRSPWGLPLADRRVRCERHPRSRTQAFRGSRP